MYLSMTPLSKLGSPPSAVKFAGAYHYEFRCIRALNYRKRMESSGTRGTVAARECVMCCHGLRRSSGIAKGIAMHSLHEFNVRYK